MSRTLRLVPAALLISGIFLLGCPPEELPPAVPDTVQLTLNEYTVSADSGTIVASALLTDDAVPLAGLDVEFTLTDFAGTATVQTATTNDAGVAETTFTDVRAAGEGTVVASSLNAENVTDNQTFTITSGVAAALDLRITDPPDGGTGVVVEAGNKITVAVDIFDAYSNPAQGAYNLSTDAPGATYSGPQVDGLTAAGTAYTLTATLASDTSKTDSTAFDIIPGPADTARIVMEPGTGQEGTSVTVEAGAALTVDCFIDDAFGNQRDDTFNVAEITTTATTFAGGAPTIAKVSDDPGTIAGGTRFTIGDAAAPLNVLGTGLTTSCLGTAGSVTAADANGALTIQDTTAPTNVTFTINSPVRTDRALAPNEQANITIAADDIVGINRVELVVMMGSANIPNAVRSPSPAPGTTSEVYLPTVSAGAATFDILQLRALVQDASGNSAQSAMVRFPIDDVADDPGVAMGFFVRTHAINSDLTNATALTVDPATHTLYYLRPNATAGDGDDIVQIDPPGTLTNIKTMIGGAGNDSAANGLFYSQDFSGAFDFWMARTITTGADRLITGVDEANGNVTDLVTDSDANLVVTDVVVADIGNGARLYNVLEDTAGGTIAVREIDNMGGSTDLAADISADVTTPGGLSYDATNIYVTDASDGDILQVDAMGGTNVVATATAGTTNVALINTAAGFAGDLLVTNTNGHLHKIDVAGGTSMDVCQSGFFGGATDVAFDKAATLDVDGDGNADNNIPTAFVLDSGNGRIYRVQGF